MARKISFINYKGGVGKTSVIVNLASCLVDQGKRVLLIDLDAQSNASIWLMRLDRWNKLNGTDTGEVYSIFNPGTVSLSECIIKDVVSDKDGNQILPGLDIIPTTFALIDIEHEYDADPQEPPYLIFQEELEAIEKDYDFILFDCPPNVLRAAQLGLFNSNEVYVPSNPDALSLIGYTLLTDKLAQFNRRSASFRRSGMGKPAIIQGIVFNSIKGNVDIEVPKMRMQFRLNQYKNAKRAGPNAKIFDAQIRDAMVVRRAVTLGLPVLKVSQAQEDPDSVLNDYQSLAKELIAHGDELE